MINLRRNRTFGLTFGLADSRRGRKEIGEYVRGSLWVLPGTAVLVALIAGSVLSLVPVPRDWLLYKLLFQGTPDDARTLLIGTAGTMISVVAVVLGLTVVALQVASGQYSPRLLGNFLRDRHTQITLSVFVATSPTARRGFTQSGYPAAVVSRSFRGSRSLAQSYCSSRASAFSSISSTTWPTPFSSTRLWTSYSKTRPS